MLSIVRRHYRRFTTFSFGMAFFTVALIARMTTDLSHPNLAVFFVVSVLTYGAIALSLYAYMPRRRCLLEMAGVTGVLVAFIFSYLNGSGIVAFLTGVSIFAIIFSSTWLFLRSKMAIKIGARTVWKDRHAGQIAYPARLIWRHIVPGASDPCDHCTGMMDSYRDDPEDPTTVHVSFKGRSERKAEYALTFLEQNKPNLCRFFFQGEEADGTFVDGIFAIRITHLDSDTSFVACNEERSGLPLRTLIERWFDDAMGFHHDRLVAKLDACYGNGAGITKPMPEAS